MQQFRDRRHAGRLLGQELLRFRGEPAPLILALPRGGVPVAFEVARVLKAPLDIFLVRKLGVPGQEELAMGAIASGGTRVLNDEIVRALRIPERTIDDVEARERRNLESRERLYRGSAPRAAVEARDVILIDDGLATGSTMRAAVSALRAERPSRIIVAVPVGAEPTCELLRRVADEVICLRTPQPFQAVGLWYEDFDQVTDATVRELLRAASGNGNGGQDILIPSGGVDLAADLVIPESARGLVLFAHGSGSSRKSPRNRLVAARLQSAGYATLLFDLLTPDEERIDARTAHLRFDIPLLARRLSDATVWACQRPLTRDLPVGYFGASTGAAAALVAAAENPEQVRAIVSRGGRPDLAGESLDKVTAPTLLIVGGADTEVIDLNERALQRMHAKVKLEIVEGATHLFEEPGALEDVSTLAIEWFDRYLR